MRPAQAGFADHIIHLARTLTCSATLPRTVPQDGDTPASWVLRTYAQTYTPAYQIPGVRVEGSLDMTHRGIDASAAIELHLYSERGHVRDLRGLKRALYPRDRTLFGRLMYELREVLAPYAPIFTGLDAVAGEERMLFGDDWYSMTADALLEATERDDAAWSERELTRWARRQGMFTPLDLGWKYPWTIWTEAGKGWPPLDPRLEAVRDLPGIPEVIDVLALVRSFPPEWAIERSWWRDGVHPGRVDVVICQADQDRDPVLECYREMDSQLAEMEHEEPLVVLEVSDAQDHARAVQFVQACVEVRSRVNAMWQALGT